MWLKLNATKEVGHFGQGGAYIWVLNQIGTNFASSTEKYAFDIVDLSLFCLNYFFIQSEMEGGEQSLRYVMHSVHLYDGV